MMRVGEGRAIIAWNSLNFCCHTFAKLCGVVRWLVGQLTDLKPLWHRPRPFAPEVYMPNRDKLIRDEISRDILIRDFQPGDTEAVIALWGECGLTRPWNDPNKDIDRKMTDLNGAFWVACEDNAEGQIVGAVMVGYDGHRGSINYLAVAPSHQRTGLGALIMKNAEEFLIEKGCPKVSFCVRRDNHGVMSFYDRLGYEVDEILFLGKRLISDD